VQFLLKMSWLMTVNTITEDIERHATGEEVRLPVLMAGVAIAGLSVLCWMPLLLPILSFLHH
jgi:hypothetical protein